MDHKMPGPPGRGSLMATPVAVPVPAALALPTVMVKPIGVPAGTAEASAVLVMLRAGGSTTMLAVALADPVLVDVYVAVLTYVPPEAPVVGLEMWTLTEDPGPIVPMVQANTCDPAPPVMAQLPRPV